MPSVNCRNNSVKMKVISQTKEAYSNMMYIFIDKNGQIVLFMIGNKEIC